VNEECHKAVEALTQFVLDILTLLVGDCRAVTERLDQRRATGAINSEESCDGLIGSTGYSFRIQNSRVLLE
jgi:hypothetical protein